MIRRDRDRPGAPSRTTVPAFLDRARETNERLELRGGRIFVTTRPGRVHDKLRARTAETVRRQLQGRPWRVLEGEAVKLDDHNVLRPDIAVVFAERDPGRIASDPVVVIEIIEPTSADADRGERGQHYRDVRSIEHYVLVSSDVQRVELFSREAARSWSYRSYDGLHRMVPLTALDLSLLLASVYEGIDIAGGQGAG